MTDRIDKALNRLSEKEKIKLKEIINLIRLGELDGLDLKKLKGRKDVYRIRKGDMRIIFIKKDFDTYILSVERRTDTTYN
jgi:mRNA-degrading endonuclease RelE of RelBE toxin-antitoxin system